MYSVKITPSSALCGAIPLLIIPPLSRHYCNFLGSIAMDRPIPQSAFVSCWDYKSLTTKKQKLMITGQIEMV
eukprot:123591-Ditylum_brightwellii.AAC.1